MAKQLHRSRNSIIAEALTEWIDNHSFSQWPPYFFDFPPIDDVPDFKALRRDLKEIPRDPFS